MELTQRKGERGRELPGPGGIPERSLFERPVSLAISCAQEKQSLWIGGAITNSLSFWPLNSASSRKHPSEVTPALLPARLPQSNLCALPEACLKLLP